jgi:hypothetical protein
MLLLVVVAILVTSARNVRLGAEQALAARRAELANLEQLWWPAVPSSLNAAPVYARAYERIVPLDRVPGARSVFEEVWEKRNSAQATSPALVEWVRRNDAALAFAAEGSRRPGYASLEDALWRSSPFGAGREGKILRLEMDRIGHDPSAIDNQISRRRIGDLLQTRSLQRAFAGQLAPAVEDANALLSLADQTQSPWLHPERLVERLLEAPGVNAATLSALHVARAEGLDTQLQRLLIRSEHAQLELWERLTRTNDPLDTAFKGTHEIFWSQASIAEMEKAYDDLWEAAYAPPAQRVGRLREAQKRARALPSAQFWTARVIDGLDRLLRDQAARDCAAAGVAVARYRLAHGAWPERLDQLVPELLAQVPSDPFDGAPLRYKTAAAGARIYSVGPNLRDDGGAAESENAGDVTFNVRVQR